MAPDKTLRNRGMVQLVEDPPVLFWQGGDDPHADGEKYFPGIPARDLSEHGIARVIYTQTIAIPNGPLVPGTEEYDQQHKNLTDLLKASGLYATTPKEPMDDSKEAQPAEPVSTPQAAEPVAEVSDSKE